MVKCYSCQKEKDASEFYKAKNAGHREDCHSYCKECVKSKIIAAKRENRQKYRKEVMAGYGNKCAACGFNDIRALVLDHVENNGAEERKYWRGKMDFFYKKIIDDGFPSSYQVLCANCNAIKEFERQKQ